MRSEERNGPALGQSGASKNDRISCLAQRSLEELPVFLALSSIEPGGFSFAVRALCCARFFGRASGSLSCPAFPFRASIRLANLS